MSITMTITTAIAAVTVGAPPAAPIPAAAADIESKRAGRIAQAETPATPWVVTNVKTPGGMARVITRAIPVRVVIAGAVDNSRVVHIGTGVAWQVAYVHYVVRVTVNTHVGNVINRRGWWNRIDDVGYRGRNGPRTGRAACHKPHCVIDGIVCFVYFDHWCRRIQRVIHRRVFDIFELRVAVVFHIEAGFVAIDGCRLRYLGIDHRFLGQVRAGYRV